MTSKNDITGDTIQTKPQSDKYSEGWERIFGKKKRKEVEGYYPLYLSLEQEDEPSNSEGKMPGVRETREG